MSNFNWDEFKSGMFAVTCKTKELADDFLTKCKEEGIIWQGNMPIDLRDEDNWYGSDTVYEMTTGLFGVTPKLSLWDKGELDEDEECIFKDWGEITSTESKCHIKSGDQVAIVQLLCDEPQVKEWSKSNNKELLHVCNVTGTEVYVKEYPYPLNAAYLAKAE